MIRPWIQAVLRLAGLLAGVGLATSRLGLVAHELIGHGAVAVAAGGRVLGLGLFWFAGGWIRYRLAEPSTAWDLAVAVGGIAVEAAIGLALWIALARRTSLAARIARGVGAALGIHAAWYLATGTWHGFGDGAILYRELGSLRPPVALAAGAAAVALAYAGARAVLGALASTIPGARLARVGGVAAAVAIAGGLQLGLAITEVRARRDATYGAVMQPERDRAVARELARWQQQQRERGAELSDAARQQRARELAAQHRELPFAHLLGALTLLAIAVGAARAPSGAETYVTNRLLVIAGSSAGGAIALVIALDAWFA